MKKWNEKPKNSAFIRVVITMKEKLKTTLLDIKKNRFYYLLLLPFLLMFLVFKLIPVLASVVLSFTDFNMVQIPHFNGITNYMRLLFSDDVFMKAFKNTLVFALVTGPIGYILSFVIAWLINNFKGKTRALFTFFVYSPILGGNIYFIWTYIFSADSKGLLNSTLMRLSMISAPIEWLSDTKYNFYVCIIVIIWMSFGAGFLSFISGLQSLDPVYYEAASLDGLRNRWQELYYVTFPQMGPQLLFGAVTSIAGAFAIGAQNATLTGNPSTDYSTHTLILHMEDYATVRYELGYACAIAVVLFAIMVISYRLINKVLSQFNS